MTIEHFGQFSSSVTEVLDFVQHHGILQKPFDGPLDGKLQIHLVSTLEDIERFRDPDADMAEIKGDINWSDILSRMEDEFHDARESHPGVFDEQLRENIRCASGQLWSTFDQQLSPILPEIEVSNVDGFFYSIMLLRAVNGATDSFSEQLFDLYRANGYPCGWRGAFPDGKIVVYTTS